MTNDSNDFKVGKVYETNDDGRDFENESGWYYSETHIEDLKCAEFEEIIEKLDNSFDKDRYWKCVRADNGAWFKANKIYKTDKNGYECESENHSYTLKDYKMPVDFIPRYSFEEVSKEDWMEQEYKAYYEEEEKMKRHWKCIYSCTEDFTEGQVYVTDEEKGTFTDDVGYTWTETDIDEVIGATFVEITEMCNKQESANDGGSERCWKCIESTEEESDFKVGKVYISDKNKLNFTGNDGDEWTVVEIDNLINYKFVEVGSNQLEKNEDDTRVESSSDMINSNSKGTVNDSDRHMEICTSLNETFKKKNSDYGNSFSKSYEIFGLVGATSRIYDKMNRLLSLTVESKEREVADEPIEDTLLDMANYCILTYMELTRKENK